MPFRQLLVDRADVDADVRSCVRGRLANSPYGGHFNDVTWQFKDGELTLRGVVCSYYMKQVLQTLLRDIRHVTRINNEVSVDRHLTSV